MVPNCIDPLPIIIVAGCTITIAGKKVNLNNEV
jgi:hypothetical protein